MVRATTYLVFAFNWLELTTKAESMFLRGKHFLHAVESNKDGRCVGG